MAATFEITTEGNTARITTPYNPAFVDRIKRLGGRWDSVHRVWAVSLDRIEETRAAMRAIYGRDDVEPADLQTVTVRTVKDSNDYELTVSLFGVSLARAKGRDSGGYPGDGVHFLEGFPKSGGSRNNPYCYIPAGAVFKIDEVPAAKLSDVPSWAEIISSCPASVDLDVLRQEREKLAARIAEIDAILTQANA